jgi:nitrous oxidase accessory protein NosD
MSGHIRAPMTEGSAIRKDSRRGKKFWLGLILLSISTACTPLSSETRYVSKTGSNTPPYTTPETAAGTIQEAVDAAGYRDVVKVGPGVYVEQVILHDGVVLWGAVADQTIVKQLEDAPYGDVIAGAADAEIRGIHIVSPEYHEFQFFRGTGVYLGPWPGQLVSDCTITGPFIYGVECEGLFQGEPSVIRRCTIERAHAGVTVRGSWVSCIVEDCVMRNNKGFGVSAGYSFGTIAVVRSTISGSTSGIYMVGAWDVSVENCTVENSGSHGILAEDFAVITVWSSVISGTANGTGVLCCDYGTVEVLNCTVAWDRFGISGGGFGVRVANTIVWGGEDPLRYVGSNVSFSDIEGGYEGEGNINADPLFVNPSAGDFRLGPRSPCIDAGTPPGTDPYRPGWCCGVDRAGRDRKVQVKAEESRIDMGAYEYYVNDLSAGPDPDETALTWSSKPNRTYSIFYTDDLVTWHLADSNVLAADAYHLTSWTDDGTLTEVPPSLAPRRFYRILENP